MFCESGLMIISLLIAAHKYLRCFGNRALICAAGDELAGGKTDTRRGPSVRGARLVRTPTRAVRVTSPRRLIGRLSDSSPFHTVEQTVKTFCEVRILKLYQNF